LERKNPGIYILLFVLSEQAKAKRTGANQKQKVKKWIQEKIN